MQIYQATQKGPLKMPGYIDPDDVTNVSVYWGAPPFGANVIYRIGDIVAPSTDNGYYYQCTVNGRSAAIEPTWTADEVTTGTATFIAVPWDLWLFPGEIITNSVWNVSDASITLTTQYSSDYNTSVYIQSFSPTALVEFELTNQVTKTSGEKLSRTFKYKINQQ